MKQQEYLSKLYANRFDYQQKKAKIILWKTLINNFLQNYINPEASVLDIGGGYCEFINNIRAQEKYLIDLNPDAVNFANPDVKVVNINILDAEAQQQFNQSLDTIFISNFFEHLNNKEELIEILAFCFQILKPGGSLLIIQPNFKYAIKEYYDFIDHQLPITHLSLKELLETIGFEIKVLIPKFLPYSTQGRPTSPQLLQIYLKLPLLWHFFGAQMFIQAIKTIS